jgi:hypothetical protein
MREFTNGDVISMKMSSGEEIIARFEKQDHMVVTVSKPLTLVPGRDGIQMTQSLIGMDMEHQIDFNRSTIAVLTVTKADLAAHYTSNTSTIKVPPKGILLG